MRKALAALAAATALATTMAPAAWAEPESPLDEFIYSMSAAGFNVTKENEVVVMALGLGVCVDMFNGATFPQQVADAIEVGMEATAATQLIGLAVTYLCPGVPR